MDDEITAPEGESVLAEENSAQKKDVSSKERLLLLLAVSEKLVSSAIFSLEEGNIETVGLGSTEVWDGEDYSLLRKAVATSLGKHLEEKKLWQTVFILSPFWVVNTDQLLEKKAALLKKLCEEFGWESGGYMIDDESLASYFETADEIPPSFIFVQSQPGEYRLTLIHLGKIKKRSRLACDQISPAEIKDGLEKLDFDGVLPPKFIITGPLDPEFEEKMVAFPWLSQRGDMFLHLPEIQIIDWPAMALIFKDIIASRAVLTTTMVPKPSERSVNLPAKKDTFSSIELPEGFSRNDLGEDDFNALGSEKTGEDQALEPEDTFERTLSPVKDKASFVVPRRRLNFGAFPLWKLGKTFLRGLGKTLGGITKYVFHWLFGGGFVVKALVFIGVAFLLLWTVVKREIVLYVTPEELEDTSEISLAISGKQGQNVLPVKLETAESQADGNGTASGSKTVGEKAKGKLTVYNRTDQSAAFPAGTVVVGPTELKYALLEEVKIASKTPDLRSGVDRWGEGEVKVEAAEIGDKYNLAADSSFRIKDQPESKYLVKNKEALAGGLSRQISAISGEDIAAVKSLLESQLRPEVKRKLEQGVPTGSKLLPETVKIEVASFNTDKKAGDEGENFTATLSLKASGLTVDEKGLTRYGEEKLKGKVKEGFQLDSESIKADFSIVKTENDSWQTKVVVQGKAYPQIDAEKLLQKIRAKPASMLLEEVKKQPRVFRHELITSPEIFSFFPLLPYRVGNITIKIGR